MSYLNQVQDPRRRVTAIAGVTIIHAALGLAIVVGMAVNGFVPPKDVWDPFTITPDPLPTPPPPEPRHQTEETLVAVPKTAVDLNTETTLDDAVVADETKTDQTFVVDLGNNVEPTVKPPLVPTFTPRGVRPSNNPLSWITTDDYPGRELRGQAEGVAGYRLVVGTNGRVSACDVTRSTGSEGLDAATCKFILRRARFEPATDETGAKVIGRYTGTVKWEIPD